MDREELQALAAAAEEMRRYGQVSAETLKALKEATDPTIKAFKKVETGLKGFSDGLSSTVKGLTQTGSKFTNVSPAVDATVKSVKFLTANFGIAGKAVGLFAEAVGGYAKFVMNQLDEMRTNYRALGDISATAAEGVEDLQDMFRAGGLATANLEHFIQQLKENTQGLSAFGAGMVQGTERLTAVMGKLTDPETTARFERMGISVETATAMSVRQTAAMARLGFTQTMTTNQVVDSLKNYIEQVDLIARVTGQTRAEQEDRQREALLDARFRAKLLDMEAKGRGEEAQKLNAFVRSLPPQLSKTARDISVFGYATTTEGRKTNMYTQDQLRQSVNGITETGLSVEDALARTMHGASQGVQTFNIQLRKSGNELSTAIELMDFDAQVKAAKQLSKELGREIDIVKDAALIQKKLKDGTNATNTAFANATVNITEAGKNVKTLQQALALDAVPAVEGFTDAIDQATDLIRRVFGIGGPRTKAEKAQNQARADVKSREKTESPIRADLRPGYSIKSGTRPSGEALDVYDRKAMAQAAKMGLADTSLMNPAVQNMANAYRREDKEGTLQLAAIRDLIGKYESPNGYDILSGGTPWGLSKMSVADVMKLQDDMLAKGYKSTAVGKYQIIKGTLQGLVKELNIDPNAKFDRATQDRLGDALIRRRGFSDYQSGKISKEQFMRNLSQEWAALPAGPDGKSYYEGQNGNRGLVGWDVALQSFQRGGVFSQAAGMAMLHGPEAVVPLPDGRTIPVEITSGGIPGMSGMADSLSRLATAVDSLRMTSGGSIGGESSAQMQRLDSLIRVMENQVSVSNKILRAQQ